MIYLSYMLFISNIQSRRQSIQDAEHTPQDTRYYDLICFSDF